ncbi:hypothetical protein NHJ6243_010165, partial [Beauveria neobassiana]
MATVLGFKVPRIDSFLEIADWLDRLKMDIVSISWGSTKGPAA